MSRSPPGVGEEGSCEWGLRSLLLPPAECPAGTFGLNCSGSCSCRGAPCDPVTGQCLCPPGRTGDDCGAGEWQPCPGIPSFPCPGRVWGPQPRAVFGKQPLTPAPEPHRPHSSFKSPQQLQEPTSASLGSGCGHLWLPRGCTHNAPIERCTADVGHGDRLASSPQPSLGLWFVLPAA